MPRPKTVLTDSKIQIHVRVTEPQKIQFIRLGGSKWLRTVIDQAIQQRQQKEPTR